MPTRREFLQTAAAGVLAVARPPRLFAAKYDLLLKGGRVIDPSQGIDRIMDVAIGGGRIADLRRNIAASDAGEVVDVRGKLVTPGLIDLHSHVADPAMPPAHCLSTGVTAQVDAGSRGADNVGDLVEIARAAPNRVRIFLNLARRGLGGTAGGELLDFANADAEAARRAIEASRDVIIGIKARLSRTVAGERDLDAIRRAHEVTVPLNLPLMVHVGQTASPLPAIVALLRRGDIVTHIYSPPPNSLFDDRGRVFPEIREARRRGVWFDIGNGRNGHITWDVAERAIQQDFLPDTISSDLTAPGMTVRVFDFPTVLSKFLLLGMPLEKVIACATANAARAIPAFQGLGTLRKGAPADIAVFELRQGDFEFVDNLDAKRIGRQKLVAYIVINGGKRVG
ncbi:MAG: amidohydrolase family protein [Terriglobia bacterium]